MGRSSVRLQFNSWHCNVLLYLYAKNSVQLNDLAQIQLHIVDKLTYHIQITRVSLYNVDSQHLLDALIPRFILLTSTTTFPMQQCHHLTT